MTQKNKKESKTFDYNIPIDLICFNGNIIKSGITINAANQGRAVLKVKNIIKDWKNQYKAINICEADITCKQDEEIIKEIEKDFGLIEEEYKTDDGDKYIITTHNINTKSDSKRMV